MRHISQNFSCVIQQNHIEFIQTLHFVLANNHSPIRHTQSFIFNIHNHAKIYSNRDNHSDRTQRRVVACRDSTNRTQNQHLTSVGACSASTTHKKSRSLSGVEMRDFSVKRKVPILRRFGYRLVGALRLRSVTRIPNHSDREKHQT